MVDLLEKKCGESRFMDIVLKLHTAGQITELNFAKTDIEEIILPLTQLGLIEVENKYFAIRPTKEKTRYQVFWISRQGENLVRTIVTKLDISKRVSFLLDKYPPKFLAFMMYAYLGPGGYDEGSEDEYKQLLEKGLLSNLVDDFKKDMEKLKCAFWFGRHSSRRVEPDERTSDILMEFREVFQQRIPKDVVDQEMDEFTLANLIESSFLKPQPKHEWYEEFADRVVRWKLQNLWTSWKEKLASEKILQDQVVLDTSKLRAFLNERIEKIRINLAGSSKSEEKAEAFIKVLQEANIVLSKNDISDLLLSCENRKDFSIFISAAYRVLHDQEHIKDEVVDPIRSYFHH